LTVREQHWIDCHSWSSLFNLSPTAQSTRGVKYSEAAKANLRAAHKRTGPRKISNEERAARAERMRNRVCTPEIRAKLSASLKGRTFSPETLAKFSATRKGRKPSAATIASLREAAKRKRSPETRGACPRRGNESGESARPRATFKEAYLRTNRAYVRRSKEVMDHKEAKALGAPTMPADLEALRKIDLAGYINQYVPLTREGNEAVACCPFHAEDTPSFKVSISKTFGPVSGAALMRRAPIFSASS